MYRDFKKYYLVNLLNLEECRAFYMPLKTREKAFFSPLVKFWVVLSHIAKKFKNTESSVDDDKIEELDSAIWHLWHVACPNSTLNSLPLAPLVSGDPLGPPFSNTLR